MIVVEKFCKVLRWNAYANKFRRDFNVVGNFDSAEIIDAVTFAASPHHSIRRVAAFHRQYRNLKYKTVPLLGNIRSCSRVVLLLQSGELEGLTGFNAWSFQ